MNAIWVVDVDAEAHKLQQTGNGLAKHTQIGNMPRR